MFSWGTEQFPDISADFLTLLEAQYEELHISKLSFWGHLEQPLADGYLADCSVICHPTYGEVFPQGLDKAYGVRVIANRLGFPRDQLVAFGDSANDLAMLAYAGTGVILPQAPPELESVAAFRTQNGPTGVAEALTHLFFEKAALC